MAVTAHKNFPGHSFSDITSGTYAFVQWIADDHPDLTGLGYDVVEAFDGTDRDTPSGGTDLSHLPGTNGWSDGTIGTDGAWIVLRAQAGRVAARHMVYIERGDVNTINFKLIPYDDFETGGTATSPPTFPDTSVGAGSSLVFYDIDAVTDSWYAVGDEAMFSLITDGGASGDGRWTYVGEVEPISGQEAADPRPFVIWDDPLDGFDDDSNNSSNFSRSSPFNSESLLRHGHCAWFTKDEETNAIFNDVFSTGDPMGSGTLGIEPIGVVPVVFDDISHIHMVGYLRNIMCGGDWLPPRGTIMSGTFLTFRDFGAPSSQQGISHVMAWDGVTNFGGNYGGGVTGSVGYFVSGASGLVLDHFISSSVRDGTKDDMGRNFVVPRDETIRTGPNLPRRDP
jgi:hypothetical protein